MNDIASLRFTDVESGEEAVVICRATTGRVSLCVSLRHGADVEVHLAVEDCRKLLQALNAGLNAATERV
jgi:hypothetical protein